MRGDNRAISTVADVALGLLLISAAVVTMGLFLTGDETQVNEDRAEDTAQALTTTTVTVEYDVRAVRTHAEFSERRYGTYRYERVAHGTTAELLAEAAVTNVTFPTSTGPVLLTYAGRGLTESVDGAVRNRIAGSGERVRITAVWRPHNRSSIEGRAVAGRRPPGDADTSVTTMRVPSGFPSPSEDRIAQTYRDDGKRGVARVVAEAMVAGYFPTVQTQLDLEDDTVQGALARYRYRRMERLVEANGESVDYPTDDAGRSVLSRQGANATAANAALVPALTAVLETELRDEFPSDVSARTIAESVSTGEVVIVVTTW